MLGTRRTENIVAILSTRVQALKNKALKHKSRMTLEQILLNL